MEAKDVADCNDLIRWRWFSSPFPEPRSLGSRRGGGGSARSERSCLVFAQFLTPAHAGIQPRHFRVPAGDRR